MKNNPKVFNLHNDKIKGVFIDGLSEHIADNFFDCLNLLKKGERTRKIRQTRKNDMSSRSHTIFQIIIETDQINQNGFMKVKQNV